VKASEGILMYRSLIIARIRPGSERQVADVFAESDRTDLPYRVGVRRRELYVLGDCYVHVVETSRPAEPALAEAARLPGFQEVSERLRPFVEPYLPTWQGPRDAVARRIYSWTPEAVDVEGAL
jgi:cyclase